MIPEFPAATAVTLEHRPLLHPLFKQLSHGISEFTFANIFLFRHTHNYRISCVDDKLIVILGKDGNRPFFMLPFGIPKPEVLDRLFQDYHGIKCLPEDQKGFFEDLGFAVVEDRDNFDYLYLRKELAELSGRKFHKKRNLVKAFVDSHNYVERPLLEDYLKDGFQILEDWKEAHGEKGDYAAAWEALEKSWDLQLCGGIYYVDERPVAYTLGEELACGTSFVIHFEKAVPGYKGLFQFINKSFASILPEKYVTINREQDLGDDGLRQAKHSYKPTGYVKKYRVIPNS